MDSSSADVSSQQSDSSGAKARVKYVPFENIWPDNNEDDMTGFEAAVSALNERCRVLERQKEHLRQDIYHGDERARIELEKLTRESAFDPNEEIKRWRREQ
eukprot:554529-Pleurochrysis_carterae.AAC.1